MLAKGNNGTLSIDKDNILISRQGAGFLTLLNQGIQGDKTIPIKNITAIQWKEPGMTVGYIRFSINGRDPVGGAMEATRDENALLFSDGNAEPFRQIRKELQSRIDAGFATAQPGAVSAADEIEKLGSLMERGLLTREEFDAKKRQLLAL